MGEISNNNIIYDKFINNINITNNISNNISNNNISIITLLYYLDFLSRI